MPVTIARWLARLTLYSAAALAFALSMPALAAAQTAPPPTTFTVTTESELRSALGTAASGDTIVFGANITLTAGDLPNVGASIAIDGAGFALSGNNQFRGFLVAGFATSVTSGPPPSVPITVSIQNLTIRDTVAAGGNGGAGGPGGGGGAGMGGALFIGDQATVSVANVNLISNSAVGGNGGIGAGFGDGGGGGGMGGNGGTGGSTGAGGGGGIGVGANGGAGTTSGSPGVITGALNGGGGGAGGSPFVTGGNGGGLASFSTAGFGGGGGGESVSTPGTPNGGFGGGSGGGGTTSSTNPAIAGYGGGGGGNQGPAGPNPGGTFGGNGGTALTAGGGGGAGLGGAIFVQQSSAFTTGGTLSIDGAFVINGASVTAGNGAVGGGNGSALGSGVFIQGNSQFGLPGLTFQPGAGQTVSIGNDIVDELGQAGTPGGARVSMGGAGTLVLGGSNLYSGGTELFAGTMSVSKDSNLGLAGTDVFFTGGTFQLTGTDNFSRGLLLGTGPQTVNVTSGQAPTWSGLISDADSPAGLNVTGGGTLNLTNVNNSYSLGTSITGNSKVVVGDDAALGAFSGGVILGDATSSGTLGLNAATSFFSIRAVTLQGGGGTIETIGTTDATLEGPIDGSGSLSKDGAGVLTLMGNNSYSGTTLVNAGILKAGSLAAFGFSPSLSVASGATADFNGFGQTFNSLAGTGTVALNFGAGLTVGGDNSNSSFAGVISGDGGVSKTGTGAWTLSGTNTFTGGLTLTSGTLFVGADANLGGAGAVTLSDQTTLGLTSSGTFAHDLRLAPTSSINVSTGLLGNWSGIVSDGPSVSVPIPGTLQVTGGGTLALGNAANSYSGGTVVTGGATVSVASDGALGAAGGNVTLGDASSAGTLALASTGAFSSTRGITVGAFGGAIDTSSATAATLSGAIGGQGGLTKTGAGTLTLAGANTFGGGLTLFAGTLNVSADANLGSGTVTLGDATTLGLTGGGVFTRDLLLGGTSTVSVGAGQSATWNGLIGDVALPGPPPDATAADVLPGAGTLQLTGGGTLTLGNAANSYSRGTIVVGGSTLDIGADSALGVAGSGLILGDSTSTGTLGITAAGLFSSTRAIALGTAGGTVDTSSATDATLAGVISGTGGFTKDGLGVLTLTGANTFTGGITINAGSLWGSTTSLLGNIVNNSLLGFNQTANGTFSGAISGMGGVTKDGAGSLTLSGTNTFGGGLSVLGGSINVASASNLGSLGQVFMGDATSLNIMGSGVFTHGLFLTGSSTMNVGSGLSVAWNGLITGDQFNQQPGSGALQVTGGGTLSLGNAANSYAGGTSVTGGSTLSIVTDGALGAAGTGLTLGNAGSTATLGINTAGAFTSARAITLGTLGATINTSGATAATLGGAIGGTGGLTKSGTGVLILTGANTFAGGITITGGSLWGSTTSLRGNVVNNAQLGFDQTTNGTYSGAIAGTGALFKVGTGALTLTGANSYTGGTFLNAGSIVGTTTSLQGTFVDNAELVFNQAFDGAFRGVINGVGSLTKLGLGTVSFGGPQGLTGLTWIREGALATVSGFGGSVRVDSGATLLATGTIGGSLNLNGGSLLVPAPGSQFGTFNRALDVQTLTAGSQTPSLLINGNLTSSAGSTLGLTLSPGAQAPILVNGSASLVDTHFVVTINDPNPVRSASYNAISALGGLQISGGDVTSPTSTLVPVFRVNSTALMLTLLNLSVPLAGAGTTPNAAGVGAAIDAGRVGATGDYGFVTRELTALTDSNLNTALRELSGEIHASAARMVVLDGLSITDMVRSELSNVEHDSEDGGRSAGGWTPRPWFQLSGDHSSFSSGEFSGGTANVGGGGGGVDFRPSGAWTAGVGLSMSLGDLSLSDLTETSRMTSPRVFTYYGFGFGPFHVHWGGSLARAKTTTKRTIQFAAVVPNASGQLVPMTEGVDRIASSSQVATTRDAWSDWQFTRKFGTWTFDGKLGLRFATYTRQGFDESGADSISLDVVTQKLSTREFNVDVHHFRHAGTWRPNIWLTYRRDFGESWTRSGAAFSGSPENEFEITGMPIPRDTFQGLFGITMRSGAGIGYTLEYQFMRNSDETRQGVRFKVRF